MVLVIVQFAVPVVTLLTVTLTFEMILPSIASVMNPWNVDPAILAAFWS
jgi:hypothetical protein